MTTSEDELIERLLAFAAAEDGGGSCDLQMLISPSREAADRIATLTRERDEALAQGAREERARVVAWLRDDKNGRGLVEYQHRRNIAAAIERGEAG